MIKRTHAAYKSATIIFKSKIVNTNKNAPYIHYEYVGGVNQFYSRLNESKQGYALLSHTHTYYKPQTGVVIPSTEPSGGISAPPMSTNTGGASPSENKQSELETRPVNTFVYWLIKTKLD